MEWLVRSPAETAGSDSFDLKSVRIMHHIQTLDSLFCQLNIDHHFEISDCHRCSHHGKQRLPILK